MKERTKVYLYTRVSTAMQIDGYSLEAQKNRMKAYAEFNDYEIAGEYEDAGKSGKSIEGRIEFSRMMDDIKCSKDHVSYVLVFKLSRFGRNAADVLSTLQVMQDFGVNLICVEDGIDSSKDAGKLMISVLSAVAEIERENIRIQTMEGRIQKAREGKWNGGFAPYGYDLINGELHINEEEAKTVRLIYELYVHKKMGGRLIAQYLESHDIKKLSHKNTRGDMFAAAYIQDILRNPTYCGKIAYGRRKQEKVHGTRNDYRIVWNDDYLLTDGIHQPIVSVEDWEEAQARLRSQATKYKRYDRQENEHAYLLTGIIKCPECGAGMYVSKSVKKRPDGSYYKEFRYYGCKHRRMDKGQKCTFKNQLPMELMDQAVAEVIVSLVSRPDFAAMMAEKINAEIDISALLEEIAHYEKQLRQQYAVKDRLAEDIDQLDPDDRHYQRRKSDLEERLYKMYDKTEETEEHLIEARAKKQAIDADRITRDNILSILMNFEKLYSVMSDIEKRDLMATMIADIQVYPQRQPNGQWLKSIHFKLPLIAEEELQFSLDKKDWLDMMGGVINVESAPGEGSRFEVLLEFKVDAQADDRAHTVKDCRLLLVGYAPGRVADVQDALEHTPVTAEAVERPEDAVSILRQEDVDVVLLSCQYRAPEMLRPLVRQMREAAGKPIFVFCMQAGQREEVLDIISACGLDGFVPLPFFLSNLENEMAKLRTEFGNIGNVDGTSVLNGMRLLCAEDNPLNAEILEELLHMQGATCTIYSDGKQLVEAFDHVRPSDYDVILMDVQMPVMNGYEATRALRASDNPVGRTIPIIAMTANAFADDIQQSLDAGMDMHLSKPIDIAVLEKTLSLFRTDKKNHGRAVFKRRVMEMEK